MDFFKGQETRIYFSSISENLKNEVTRMSDENISTCNFSEWVDYLCSKYIVVPITIFEDNITQDISETKVKKYNQFARHSQYEPEYYLIDGYQITFAIPYDGDSELFLLQPSTRILTHFTVYNHKKPFNDTVGSFELQFEFTRQELEDKGQEMQSFVKSQFENRFKSYRQMIEYVNQEVVSYNNSLSNLANHCLDERKKKAASFNMISQMLEIPLSKSKNAPSVVPIPLTRISRVPPKQPTKKPAPTEYSISDDNFENINRIIYSCSTAMENTARTHHKFDEEELRDNILATLCSHYNNATSETFRKIGKTDIKIDFENKAAFIGECKIWQGERAFNDAVQQVLNYSTWRDVKVSIIIFNKKNKSFQGIITQIDDWIKSNTQSHIKQNANTWDCQYYRADMNVNIRLNISAFDLYVDKTQFKDSKNTINKE